MVKGLSVDEWRKGMRTQVEADEMIAFAHTKGITDLFLHVGRQDEGTLVIKTLQAQVDFDPIKYISEIAEDLNTHLWISPLKLWRYPHKLNIYPESYLMNNMTPENYIWYLDPVSQSARQLIEDFYSELVAKYRYIKGVQIDGLCYPNKLAGTGAISVKEDVLTDIMVRLSQNFKQINADLKISLTVKSGGSSELNNDLAKYEDWSYDYLVPMLHSIQTQDKYDSTILKFDSVTNKWPTISPDLTYSGDHIIYSYQTWNNYV